MTRAAVQERRPQAEATAVEATVVEAPTCQHHWLIESPKGATSQGRCKRCGDEREFRNSATDHVWEDESGSGYNAWRGRSAPKATADGEEISAGAATAEALLV